MTWIDPLGGLSVLFVSRPVCSSRSRHPVHLQIPLLDLQETATRGMRRNSTNSPYLVPTTPLHTSYVGNPSNCPTNWKWPNLQSTAAIQLEGTEDENGETSNSINESFKNTHNLISYWSSFLLTFSLSQLIVLYVKIINDYKNHPKIPLFKFKYFVFQKLPPCKWLINNF